MKKNAFSNYINTVPSSFLTTPLPFPKFPVCRRTKSIGHFANFMKKTSHSTVKLHKETYILQFTV